MLDVRWIHGSPPGGPGDPVIQVHTVDDATFILRQSKDVNYEAPFLYLLCGTERALLLDTGAVANGGVRQAVDGLLSELVAGRARVALAEQAIDGVAHPAVRDGAGVEQQRPLGAAQQVEKRRLVVHVLALPQDERGVVDGVHLDHGVGRAAGWRPVNPPHVQHRAVHPLL